MVHPEDWFFIATFVKKDVTKKRSFILSSCQMSEKPRIAIMTPRLHEGDAVGNDTRQMHQVLDAAGYETKIFAEKWDRSLQAEHYSSAAKFLINPSDILIYHYSLAWDPVYNIFRNLKCKRVIKYHNVTPPHFFEPYHKGIANACRLGREMLAELVNQGVDYFIADSQFNLTEAVGVSGVESSVVPPLHQIEELMALEADPSIIKRYAKNDGSNIKNILMVGRIVPNKGYDQLIELMALYRQNYESGVRLFLVGRKDPQLKKYYKQLNNLINSYDLSNEVVITGQVSAAELKAYYVLSDVFCSLSRHEGFCVPLVEAMALRIPIVALQAAVIPETLDSAGLVWDDDLRKFAASLQRIFKDEELVDFMISSGYNRFQEHFSSEKIRQRFLSIVEKICRQDSRIQA